MSMAVFPRAIRRPRILPVAASFAAHAAVAAAGYVFMSWHTAPAVTIVPVEIIVLPGIEVEGARAAVPPSASGYDSIDKPVTAGETTAPLDQPAADKSEPERHASRSPVEPSDSQTTDMPSAEHPAPPDPKPAPAQPVDLPAGAIEAAIPAEPAPSAPTSGLADAIDPPRPLRLDPATRLVLAVPDSAWIVAPAEVIATLDPPRLFAPPAPQRMSPPRRTAYPPRPRPRPPEIRTAAHAPTAATSIRQPPPLPRTRPWARRIQAVPQTDPVHVAPDPALRAAVENRAAKPAASAPPPASKAPISGPRVDSPGPDPSAVGMVGRATLSGGGGLRPMPGNPAPIYPRPARERGWEGRVVLEITVDASGAVVRAEIDENSGYRILDQAAVRAVRRWRFTLGETSHPPRGVVVRVPITFKLSGET